jgi:prepilin-type N-terminal cleavage/methylation domain-containing protein
MTAPRRTPDRARGFSLIELIIALAVMGVVLIAVFSTFFRSQKVGQTMTTAVNLRAGARGANQLLERELRMAGSGWGRLPVYRYRAGGGTNTDSIFGINFGPGGAALCDSISMLGGWSAATKLTATMLNPWTNISVSSTSGFFVNDLIVVSNGNTAHLFQVTSINAGAPGSLVAASSSAYNPPNGVNLSGWPVGGYLTQSPMTLVYRVTWVTYRVDSTSFRRPALVRREFGGASQLVAYDVSGFQIRCRMQDGSVTRSPTDIDMIDEVVPVIWTRLSVPGRTATTDSVWAAVRPRTF